jgi:hypothetical protein
MTEHTLDGCILHHGHTSSPFVKTNFIFRVLSHRTVYHNEYLKQFLFIKYINLLIYD